MAATGVFGLTRFTALASGDVIPVVDISDTTQSAHGSLDSITVANFFGGIPVPVAITSASATAFTAGLNGATFPAFTIDASTALSATGLKVKSAAAAAGVAVSVTSSGTDENLTVNAKGAGTVTLGSVSTGAVLVGGTNTFGFAASTRMTAPGDGILQLTNAAATAFTRLNLGGGTSAFPAIKRSGAGIHLALADDSGFATVNCGALSVNSGQFLVTFANAQAAAIGANGAANPQFVVDSSAATVATGILITGAAAAGGAAIAVISSGTDEKLTLNAKGAGTIGIGSVSTGRVTITPVTTITGALTLSATLIAAGAGFTGTVAITGTLATTSYVAVGTTVGTGNNRLNLADGDAMAWANDGKIMFGTNTLTLKGGTGGTVIKNSSAATIFTVADSGNVTATSSITTSAPTSGTAAPWKFGTVAVVSPTSPNRTIELDVNGTIYYLAAKTTNN